MAKLKGQQSDPFMEGGGEAAPPDPLMDPSGVMAGSGKGMMPPNPDLIPSGGEIDDAIHPTGLGPEGAILNPGLPPVDQGHGGEPTQPGSMPQPSAGGGVGAQPQPFPSATATLSPQQMLQSQFGQINERANKGISMRSESAREGLERNRSAEMDTLMAQLAERGLVGSGAEQQSLQALAERMQGQQNTALRDIYSDEMNQADNQMIQLLSLTTGLSIEEAKRAVEMSQLGENANQFNANYGLNAQRLSNDISSGNIDQLIELFKALQAGSGRPNLS